MLCLMSDPMSSFGRRVISIHIRWAVSARHQSSLFAFLVDSLTIHMTSTDQSEALTGSYPIGDASYCEASLQQVEPIVVFTSRVAQI